MSAVIEAVAEAIRELGDAPGAIADTLAARGVKGVRVNSEECPLARVAQAIPGAEDAEVGTCAVYVGDEWFDLPDAAHEFRFRFDRGDYPDLIELAP